MQRLIELTKDVVNPNGDAIQATWTWTAREVYLKGSRFLVGSHGRVFLPGRNTDSFHKDAAAAKMLVAASKEVPMNLGAKIHIHRQDPEELLGALVDLQVVSMDHLDEAISYLQRRKGDSTFRRRHGI